MLLDLVLLLAMALIVALCAASGLTRTVVMLVIFYVLCLILGMGVVALNLAQSLGDVVVSSLGQGPRSPIFYQGIVFVVLLIPGFILAAVLTNAALENTAIAFLRWGDNILGTVVGIALALSFASVLCNVWGVIVSTQWQPIDTWGAMRSTYLQSVLRPMMLQVLIVFRRALFPFALSGYPVFFVPQA